MARDDLLKKISELESINDQLQAEIHYLDQLLRQIGFEEGLKTLKYAAKELLEEDLTELLLLAFDDFADDAVKTEEDSPLLVGGVELLPPPQAVNMNKLMKANKVILLFIMFTLNY